MKLVNARTLCLDLDILDENDLHEERIDYPLALKQDKDHLPDPQRLKDRIAFHKKMSEGVGRNWPEVPDLHRLGKRHDARERGRTESLL